MKKIITIGLVCVFAVFLGVVVYFGLSFRQYVDFKVTSEVKDKQI